jgi:L-alanine-DL-glutamate epimerase-like enolase superfamily enzyme
LIEPAIEVDADGTIAVPDAPGIGVHIVQDRVESATVRAITLDPFNLTAA